MKQNKNEHYHVLKVNGKNFQPHDLIDELSPHLDSRYVWYVANALKYLIRSPFKHPDKFRMEIEKAHDYLGQLLERIDKNEHSKQKRVRTKSKKAHKK